MSTSAVPGSEPKPHREDGLLTTIIDVENCEDCPFMAESREQGCSPTYCDHDSGPKGWLESERGQSTTPPDWCPLRKGGTVVRIPTAREKEAGKPNLMLDRIVGDNHLGRGVNAEGPERKTP